MTAVPGLIEEIRRRLDEVRDPCSVGAGSPMGLDEMGLVKGIAVDAGRVTVSIRLTSPSCLMHGYFIDGIKEHVRAVNGVESVEVRFDAGMEWEPGMIREDIRRARERRFRERVAGLELVR
jgi:metal-sulfur cluster biosynthetic enzyme